MDDKFDEFDVDQINNRADFVQCAKWLASDFSKSWENDTLPRFLEALSAVAQDTKIPPDESSPDWKLFAKLLMAARVYE